MDSKSPSLDLASFLTSIATAGLCFEGAIIIGCIEKDEEEEKKEESDSSDVYDMFRDAVFPGAGGGGGGAPAQDAILLG
jgi:hypothetical protein